MADPQINRNTQRAKAWREANPERAAYDVQRRMAARRGIGWEFTFEEWWAWWQIDDRWSRRGRRKGQLVMARPGDIGPYSPDNVVCFTHGQNVRDKRVEIAVAATKEQRKVAAERGHPAGYHLRVRGDGHPSSRAVLTPDGRFGSIVLAAESLGITRKAVHYRVYAGKPGWSFADPPGQDFVLESFYRMFLWALWWVRGRPWCRPSTDCSFAEMDMAIGLCRARPQLYGKSHRPFLAT